MSNYPTVSFQNDYWGHLNRLRTGPQYSFAVGNTDRPIRAAVTKWSSQVSEYYVQGIGCTYDLACEEPSAWSTLGFQVYGAGCFNPVVAASPGGFFNPSYFTMQYYTRFLDPGGRAVDKAVSRLDRASGGPYTDLNLYIIGEAQDVCPDTRNYGSWGGYWGDYDDMKFLGQNVRGQTGLVFLSAMTDSSDGCVLRQTYNSQYQNVSSTAFTW